MKVLGIESSCDETGIALIDTDTGHLWQRLYSQIEQHREYGGVVPELASRDHVVKAAPLIREVIDEFGSFGAIDGIPHTRGPGTYDQQLAVLSHDTGCPRAGWRLTRIPFCTSN